MAHRCSVVLRECVNGNNPLPTLGWCGPVLRDAFGYDILVHRRRDFELMCNL